MGRRTKKRGRGEEDVVVVVVVEEEEEEEDMQMEQNFGTVGGFKMQLMMVLS